MASSWLSQTRIPRVSPLPPPPGCPARCCSRRSRPVRRYYPARNRRSRRGPSWRPSPPSSAWVRCPWWIKKGRWDGFPGEGSPSLGTAVPLKGHDPPTPGQRSPSHPSVKTPAAGEAAADEAGAIPKLNAEACVEAAGVTKEKSPEAGGALPAFGAGEPKPKDPPVPPPAEMAEEKEKPAGAALVPLPPAVLGVPKLKPPPLPPPAPRPN